VLVLALLVACGARTELDAADAATAVNCGPFPAIPADVAHPLGEACAMSADVPEYPALAAIAGPDLLVLSSRGAFTSPLHFATGNHFEERIVSRGDFLGVLVADFVNANAVDVEIALVRTDGTVLVDRHVSGKDSVDYGVAGNAGGTFAFGAFGSTWVATPDGPLLGPFDGVTVPPFVPDVDASGRVLVLPADSNSSVAFEWLEPCSNVRTPVSLTEGWPFRKGVFGLSANGQPSIETADGLAPLGVPALGKDAQVWELTASGVAMIAVPPWNGSNVSLVTLDASAQSHALTLEYPGLAPEGGGAFLSAVGDSNDPAGFGVDSAARVTMFMRDTSGFIYLHETPDGTNWPTIGYACLTDPNFDPSYTLQYAEAAGTFVVQSDQPNQGMKWAVVRPGVANSAIMSAKTWLSSDGGCASALVSKTELDVASVTLEKVTPLTLPSPVDPNQWTSTWIGDDDARYIEY
jgi:hypothetical protein